MLLNAHDHHSMVTGRHVPFRGFDPYDEVRTPRRRLPHRHQPEVSYFVTFRLADSVPQPLLRQWRHERAIWLRLHPQPWGVKEQCEYEARFIGRMQEWLDAGMGACHMRRPDVRAEVEGCLLQFDGNHYDIDAFVLMPNHVHALIKPTTGCNLSTVLQGINVLAQTVATSCSDTSLRFGWTSLTITSFATQKSLGLFAVTSQAIRRKPDLSHTNIRYSCETC